MSNWKHIEKAPRGIGAVLLRSGSGTLDPVYVGFQADDGRWVTADDQTTVHPLFFCTIPAFDCDEGDGCA
jgi:hypothetical protein